MCVRIHVCVCLCIRSEHIFKHSETVRVFARTLSTQLEKKAVLLCHYLTQQIRTFVKTTTTTTNRNEACG